jgi:hypothetical protein
MMDMSSRNQYLKQLRQDYLKTKSKKKRGELLDEAEKRTELERKYLIKKLKPKSNLDKLPSERKKRKQYYDNLVKAALVKCWQIFDRPCGQRLVTSLRTETDRLRKLGELICSDEVASKLKQISFRTIDEKLKHQKEVERQKRKYRQNIHPLLYQKIPVKISDEQDRTRLGNLQIDLVEHCGASASGEYLNTLSTTDLLSGWWEGEAVMGRGQFRTNEGLKSARNRYPFAWQGIHSDNDTTFINWHLFEYCQVEGLAFSRSRPYKKNDNCLVEQKNWTHVKKFVGCWRYDTGEEQTVLNGLYRNELRLYKNFFQPVIKLKSKVRVGGRIKRRYEPAKTPYQRVMESNEVSQETKNELKQIYDALNPAQLKREVDRKLDLLWQTYRQKQNTNNDDYEFLKVEIIKKIKPQIVKNYVAQPKVISVS